MFENDEKKEPEGEEKSPDFWAADEDDAAILEQSLGAENLTTPDNEPPTKPEHPSETPFSPERKAEDEKAEKEAKKELDAKPAEEKPAEEVKPAPVVEEKKPADDKDNFAWREARRLRRELKEAKEREAAAAAKAAEKPADEIQIEDLDPIERAQRDAADAKRIAQDAVERADKAEKDAERRNQERDLVADVQRQEAAFKATHPDYDAAMQYVVDARKEQLEIMGKLDADAEFWINTHPDLVERHAQETGLDHENFGDIRKAAKDIAFRVAIQQERTQLLTACKRTGRNIPEAVYNLAAKMGHKAPAAAAAPAAPTPEAAAKERVQKAKASEELRQPFNQTLAAMDNNHAPLPKKISSRAELMRMPDNEQDQLIAEMDLRNPGWFENLDD